MFAKIALLAACLFGFARAGVLSSGHELALHGSPIGYGSGFGYGGYGAGLGTETLGYGNNFGYGGFGPGLGHGYGSNLGYGDGFGVGYGAGLGYVNYARSGLGPDGTETSAYQFSINHPLSHGAYGSIGVAGYDGFGNNAYGRGTGTIGIGAYRSKYGSW